MLQITVVIRGDKEFQAKMKKLGKEFYMLKDAMNSVGDALKKYYSSVGMSSQGGVFGNKWAPLTSKYAIRKAKKYPGRSPLVKTGRLSRGFAYKANQTSVYVSNEVPYFKYHQSSQPRKVIPRRASIGVNQAVRGIVRTVLTNEINAKIRRVGL